VLSPQPLDTEGVDPEHCYLVMRSRYARYDGQSFTGVLTTHLAETSFQNVGLTGKRIATLRVLATAFTGESLDLTHGLQTTGIRSRLALSSGRRRTTGIGSQKAEVWRPWRAYVAMHLWSTL